MKVLTKIEIELVRVVWLSWWNYFAFRSDPIFSVPTYETVPVLLCGVVA